MSQLLPSSNWKKLTGYKADVGVLRQPAEILGAADDGTSDYLTFVSSRAGMRRADGSPPESS